MLSQTGLQIPLFHYHTNFYLTLKAIEVIFLLQQFRQSLKFYVATDNVLLK